MGAQDVGAPDASEPDGLPATVLVGLSPECQAQVSADLEGLPHDLACTGLYSDIQTAKFAPDAVTFVPSVSLSSDGADKRRWIKLPPNTQIDNSDPRRWEFPVGTRFFKEFSYPETGAIETRFFWKQREGFWHSTTYLWNSNHTQATRLDKGMTVKGPAAGPHYVPTRDECEECHGTRDDTTLGFEQVSLGTQGAQGMSLATLVEKGLLTNKPQSLNLIVGDDGSGMAEPILRWFHVNCGVSCHNDDQNSAGYSSRLRFKLDPAQLDGRPTNTFEGIALTVGVKAWTAKWANQVRIVPGDPENSLLYKLINARGQGENRQMPPIASLRVDAKYTKQIYDWIKAMKPAARPTKR
jgi:hypothetical protein